jgi:hypothetical protein
MGDVVLVSVGSRDLPSSIDADGQGALEKIGPCIGLRDDRNVSVFSAHEAVKGEVRE